MGLPEGRGREQRDRPLATDRRQDVQRRVVDDAPEGAVRRRLHGVTGYINDQNMVERVETWVEHPILGDLPVESTYTEYRDFGGVKVPGKIVQKRAGWPTFEATITSASANPANITSC